MRNRYNKINRRAYTYARMNSRYGERAGGERRRDSLVERRGGGRWVAARLFIGVPSRLNGAGDLNEDFAARRGSAREERRYTNRISPSN